MNNSKNTESNLNFQSLNVNTICRIYNYYNNSRLIKKIFYIQASQKNIDKYNHPCSRN